MLAKEDVEMWRRMWRMLGFVSEWQGVVRSKEKKKNKCYGLEVTRKRWNIGEGE